MHEREEVCDAGTYITPGSDPGSDEREVPEAGAARPRQLPRAAHGPAAPRAFGRRRDRPEQEAPRRASKQYPTWGPHVIQIAPLPNPAFNALP